MTPFKKCAACRVSTIYTSNVRAWESGVCFECRKRSSELDRKLTVAQQRYDALLELSRVLMASSDFVK